MSIFSDLKVKDYANRNGFDLGRFSSFTSKAGYILPVFHQLTIPNSEYSLDIKQLLRTQPLQKAAFTGFSINYDVIWCPYNHLYSSFNQFIAQRKEKNTTVQPNHTFVPTFHLGNFINLLFPLAFFDYILSFCEDLQFGDNSGSQIVSTGRLRKYLFFDNHLNDSLALNVLRNLDLMEYCNLLPLLKNYYYAVTTSDEDMPGLTGKKFKDIHWNKYSGSFSEPGVEQFFAAIYADNNPGVAVNAYNLFLPDGIEFVDSDEQVIATTSWVSDYVDTWIFITDTVYFNGFNVDGYLVDSFNKSPNLFLPLAYNKAFYEYYRNEYYDNSFVVYHSIINDTLPSVVSVHSSEYVYLFNLDDYFEGMFVSFGYTSSYFWRLMEIFAVKPHQYKKDMFTGVLPSTQFGSVSMMVTEPSWLNLYAKNYSDTGDGVAVRASSGTGMLSAPGLSTGVIKVHTDPQLAISILEQRRADAMQRFRERMLRAGDKVKDIFRAHGWSEPLSEKSYEPIFLGSFDGRLDINVVASTSSTEGAELGQIAANGIASVDGKKIKVETKDFGVLMVIFHIEKDAVYDSYGLGYDHTLVEPFDFPYPELQNISLAPVPSYLLNLTQYDTVLGYLPRAFGLKTAVDKAHGEFYTSCPFYNSEGDSYIIPSDFVTGAFSDWVALREDLLAPKDLAFLYVQPRCTDSVFYQQADAKQMSDPFLVNCRFDCYTVEPLPVIGLPI